MSCVSDKPVGQRALLSLLVQPIDAGVQWTVNLVRFLYQMKHNRAVAAITKRIDAVRG